MTKVRTAARLSLAALLLAGALAACGGDDDASDDTAGSSTTQSAEAIDRDATVRLAIGAMPLTLDPHAAREISRLGVLYDTLFIVDADRELHPGLATDYVVDDTGVTLTIRSDATFGDGSSVDAAAVKASLDRARTLPTSTAKAALAAVTDVQVEAPDTVRLVLSAPQATLQYSLADVAGMIINPTAIGGDLTTTAAGSTPYDVVEFEPGKRLVVERRPNAKYWDDEAFSVKRFEMDAIGDDNTVINGLKTGTYDIANLQAPQAQAERQLGDDFVISPLPSDSAYALALRNTVAPFTDAKVRTAVYRGIDRATMATSIANNCVEAPELASEGAAGHIGGYDPLSYDPDAAGSVLEGKSLSFELLATPNAAETTRVAEVVQQQLGDLGVDVTITPLPITEMVGAFYSGDRAAGVIPTAAKADLAMVLSDQLLGAAQLAGPDAAAIQASVAQVNALELGSPERDEALQALSKQATELAVWFPICKVVALWVHDDDLHGVEDMGQQWTGLFDARYWTVSE